MSWWRKRTDGEPLASPAAGTEATARTGPGGRTGAAGCGAGRPRTGGGAGEPAGWAWGVHLYVTLEFAATSRQELWARVWSGCAAREDVLGGAAAVSPAATGARQAAPGAGPSRSCSSAAEATGTGPERRAPAGPRM